MGDHEERDVHGRAPALLGVDLARRGLKQHPAQLGAGFVRLDGSDVSSTLIRK
jgi:hypothetical protein